MIPLLYKHVALSYNVVAISGSRMLKVRASSIAFGIGQAEIPGLLGVFVCFLAKSRLGLPGPSTITSQQTPRREWDQLPQVMHSHHQ